MLVNNAGITQPRKTLDITGADYDAVLDVSLRGTLYMSQAVLPTMREQKSGAIVCISSVSAQRGGGILGGPHYSAAKAGVLGLARAMAREYGIDNIRVNCVTPGLIATDINKGLIPDDRMKGILEGIPLNRIGEPNDVAGCVRLPRQRPGQVPDRRDARRQRRHVDPLTRSSYTKPQPGDKTPCNATPSFAAPLAIAAGTLLSLAAHAQAVKLTLGHGAAPGNPRHEAAVQVRRRAEGQDQRPHRGAGGAFGPARRRRRDGHGAAHRRAGHVGQLAGRASPTRCPNTPPSACPSCSPACRRPGRCWTARSARNWPTKTAEKGMVVLGYWDNGIRHMSNSKKPLLKPEDLKGLKMRTPPDAVTVDIMQSLGAEAQQIKFAELYVALQQGVVDGQENPLMNIHASKLYEVQKFISLTGHKYEMTPFLMSKRSWDKLSDADRKAVQEAATEATALQRKLSQESDDKLVADLKAKGVRVDTRRQGRVREGHRVGGRQVDGRPDRPVRQEGDRRRARQVSAEAAPVVATASRRTGDTPCKPNNAGVDRPRHRHSCARPCCG